MTKAALDVETETQIHSMVTVKATDPGHGHTH